MSVDDSQVLQGFNCVWRIEDFTFLKADQKFLLKSQVFEDKYLYNQKWHLELWQVDDDSFRIILFQDDGKPFTEIKYSFFLLTEKGWIRLVQKEHRSIVKGSWIILSYISSAKFYADNQCNISNGFLTLSLTIHKPRKKKVLSSQCFMRSRLVHENLLHVPVREYHFIKQSDFISFSDPDAIISEKTKTANLCPPTENCLFDVEDLVNFFKEKSFQFVTLRTEKKDFTVHKALLCARSPVFNAMFEKEMKESNTNVVDIDDIDGNTLSLLLQFLHLEPLKDLDWNETKNLYYAADKYQVLKLRDKCASLLKTKLANGNVCEALILADLHEDEELKSSARKYFCGNSKTVLRSSQWKDLMRKNPELAFDTLHALAEKL